LIFSNTLDCLRVHPEIPGTLNESAIGDFLLFGSKQDPSTTTFAAIRQVPPAHTLSWIAGSEGVRRYWALFSPAPRFATARRLSTSNGSAAFYATPFAIDWRPIKSLSI
jgi:hypothetical protein